MEFHDFIISSNNTINDNKVNAKKLARNPLHQIKKLIKCVIRNTNINKSSTGKQQHQQQQRSAYYFNQDEEIADNIANEILENEIFEEIDTCEDNAGVIVYNCGSLSSSSSSSSSAEIVPVVRGQRYIPVHFARTEAGTFFWTSSAQSSSSSSSSSSVEKDICHYGDQHPICKYQIPEVQVPCSVDRWAQA